MNIFKLLFLYLLFGTSIFAQDCVGDIEAWHSNFSTLEATEKLEQNFNIGFSNTTGNTQNLDLNAKYNFALCTVSYDKKLIKIIFDTSLFFTQTDSQKSNEEYLLNFGWEQELDKEWLTYLAFNWLRNPEFKNYDHKTSVGVGIGKNLFFDGTQSLVLKVGTAYNNENYANNQTTNDSTSLNEYIEYKNQLNKISKLYLRTGALQNFHNFQEDYEVLAILGVNFTVGEKVHLTLEQEVAYDNLPSIGFKKTDTKSIVRLGYKF